MLDPTTLTATFFGNDACGYSFNGGFWATWIMRWPAPDCCPKCRITGEWRINSDEPRAPDYNDPGQPFFFNPDQFRA
ncbi:MAG: hypothetical protein IPJ94_29150 [Chloroflexi bacterium]|nr:hypothetical protein [Chloroflexota bacterium]